MLVKGASGVGVTKPISSSPLFSEFYNVIKTRVSYWVSRFICQLSPQFSCGDTCQIWMWFKEFHKCFYKNKNFTYRGINERNYINPLPKGEGF